MINFSSSRIEQVFGDMATACVAVIGDLMLDRYVWGDVTRVSPEAPVPIVSLEGESTSLGGAANVAANIDALGSKVLLYGVVGDDMESHQVRDLVKRNKLADAGILSDNNRQTIVKTRVIAHNQHLIRIDRETVTYLKDEIADHLLAKFRDEISTVSGVILQDYNKGVLSPYLVKRIIEICRRANLPIAVDPKIENFWSYKNVTLFKPNLRELEAAIAKPIKNDTELEEAGGETREKLRADYLLVTSGSKGMSLFSDDGVVHIPTRARLVHDVSGAGDTVIATIMTALVAGASMVEAATIATYAASVVVAEVGAVPVDKDKLKREILGTR